MAAAQSADGGLRLLSIVYRALISVSPVAYRFSCLTDAILVHLLRCLAHLRSCC